MRELLLVQPLHEAQAARIALSGARDSLAAERIVDPTRVEMQRRAVRAERARERPGELGDLGIVARRHDCDRFHARPRSRRGLAAAAQPLDQETGDAPEHARVALHQAVERLGGELGEQRVAHGEDRGGTSLTGEERHLSQGLACSDLAQRALAGRVVDHAQAPADHDVSGIAGIAASKQRLAAGERDPFGVGFDLGQGGGIGGVEEPGQVRRELRAPELAVRIAHVRVDTRAGHTGAMRFHSWKRQDAVGGAETRF